MKTKISTQDIRENAIKIKQNLDKGTISSFTSKLNHKLNYNDVDGVVDTLVQLEKLSNIELIFKNNLIENFDDNQKLLFIFINELLDNN